MKHLQFKGTEGFTLLELMVVIAIVGVLASIALPSYLNNRQRAQDAACLANRRNIETAESTFFASNNMPSLSIGTVYSCPTGGVYVWLISDPEDPDYPTIACSVHYAGSLKTPADAKDSPADTPADTKDSSPETPDKDHEPDQTSTPEGGYIGENLKYRNIEDGNSKKNDFVDEDLITGDGDDIINVEDDVSGSNRTISTNDGDDKLVVGDDVQHGATIDTGEGDDIIEIGGTLDDATLDTGNGHDTINLQRIRDASIITTGEGNDTVTIDDVSSRFDDGSVSLAEGNDRLVLNDSLSGTDAQFDGGEGEDTLVLEEVSSKRWNRGIGDRFQNFESVTLKDGKFSLDENNNLI